MAENDELTDRERIIQELVENANAWDRLIRVLPVPPSSVGTPIHPGATGEQYLFDKLFALQTTTTVLNSLLYSRIDLVRQLIGLMELPAGISDDEFWSTLWRLMAERT